MDIRNSIIREIKYKVENINFNDLLIESVSADKGDYCLPCFAMAKELKENPNKIANDISSTVNVGGIVEKCEVVGGYVNFFLNRDVVSAEIIKDILADSMQYTDGDGKTICIDYSSVNLAKYMHIGHLKNTIIGESIARICEALGYKVIRINYIGDYGTPFGKIIAGYEMWGNKADVDKRGIDALQELYVKFNQEAQNDPTLDDKAREIFKQIEMKDPHYYAIYQWVIDIAVKEAERLLGILGIKFDSWRGESYYSEKLDDVVGYLQNKGLTKVSEGALVVDLEDYDMPPCLIRRSDGASLYATRDIAAAIDRYNTYHFDQMFYVTGHEQMLHFKQFFKVLDLAGEEFANNLEHIHYGLFSLPTGKISSRLGKQATLVDIMDYAHAKAEEVIKDRTFNILTPEEVADKVARSALNYSALKVEVGKDCVFDIDKAFSFEGETAPYMQYTYTRIESILRKAKDMNLSEVKVDYSALNSTEAFELLKACNGLKLTIVNAYTKREPSIIVKRAMDICKTLNKFYTNTKVLGGSNSEIMAKIELLQCVKKTLAVLFRLMCIDTLIEM
ncbi:MAG: arginine--tRNA ligase [Clostridiales bacterium]|nr:arginine--tRNA ligase [Clostridiales bacterium]